jgi:hypothetical protein
LPHHKQVLLAPAALQAFDDLLFGGPDPIMAALPVRALTGVSSSPRIAEAREYRVDLMAVTG